MISYRPQVVVGHSLPKTFGCDGHAIVHVDFGRVVAEHTVNHDGLFAWCEPAIGAKPGLCLHGRCRHEEEGAYANTESNEALNEEQPAPPSKVINAVKVEQCKC